MSGRRILFWGRSDAVTGSGGEANYVTHLASGLERLGHRVAISADWNEDLAPWDVVHFSNIHRIADAEYRLARARERGVRTVLTPIFLPPAAWVRQARSGWRRAVLRAVPLGPLETARAMAETLGVRRNTSRSAGTFRIATARQRQRRILRNVDQLWINSSLEATTLMRHLGIEEPYRVVRFGGVTEEELESLPEAPAREWDVAVVGYLAPVKNHLNILEAVAPLGLRGLLVGSLSARHAAYGKRVLRLAERIGWTHVETLDHPALLRTLARTGAVVQASWFETCGMTALEALGVGAAAVITTRGFGREYFEDDAEFADPHDIIGIRAAVLRALATGPDPERARRVRRRAQWEDSATAAAEGIAELVPNEPAGEGSREPRG